MATTNEASETTDRIDEQTPSPESVTIDAATAVEDATIDVTDAEDDEQAKPDVQTLPILPLRGTVVFPLTVVPLAAAQPRSLRLIDEVMSGDRIVALVMQKDAELRSEERRVGKECRSRWSPYH